MSHSGGSRLTRGRAIEVTIQLIADTSRTPRAHFRAHFKAFILSAIASWAERTLDHFITQRPVHVGDHATRLVG